jgi:sugar/nucleoside kinase (ribokinase family)
MGNGFFDEGRDGLVVGIGSALVDILVPASDAFVATAGVPKGGMVYFDAPTIEAVVARCAQKPQIAPGGAACNTIVGIARLGGRTRFVGKRGEDDFGDLFEHDLQAQMVDPRLIRAALPTGRVLSLITPDCQRSMLTHLGASGALRPDEVQPADFIGAAVVLVEGYLVYNPSVFMHAIKIARQAGALIALDLASFTVVEQNRKLLIDVVRDYVDIVVANEDEAAVFTGKQQEEKALSALADLARLAVVKLGARGSLIADGAVCQRITPMHGEKIVDTTGAGDLWAAGLLYGLVHGLPLETCGILASACGYEVCRVMGAGIPEDGWQRIRGMLDSRKGPVPGVVPKQASPIGR